MFGIESRVINVRKVSPPWFATDLSEALVIVAWTKKMIPDLMAGILHSHITKQIHFHWDDQITIFPCVYAFLASSNNWPTGFPFPKPFPLSKTFLPLSHVSLTTPLSVIPWYALHLFRNSISSLPTTNIPSSLKTHTSPSSPTASSPF